MKRCCVCVVTLVLLAGCGSVDKKVAESALSFANEIGGEYEAALQGELDITEFTDDQVLVRVNRIEAQRSLMQEALD